MSIKSGVAGVIAELRPLFHGDYELLLRDGTSIKLSRRYKALASSQVTTIAAPTKLRSPGKSGRLPAPGPVRHESVVSARNCRQGEGGAQEVLCNDRGF